MGISFAVFHRFGKTPLRRQPLFMTVIYLGKTSKALLYTSPVIPSSPGAFLSMLATAFLHSSTVKSVSSSESAGSKAWALVSLWSSVSYSLSTGVKCSSMSSRVSLKSSVRYPSGFRRVVICVLSLLFPAANLYTSFHGLEDVVRLQYSFQDYFLPFNCCFIPCFLC